MTDRPKVGRPTKEARPLSLPLNIRVSSEDKELLDRLVEAERADRQGDAFADVTAASLVRSWIRDAARRRGFLPSLPAAPLPPVPAPAPVLPASEHEAPDKDAVRAALESALKAGEQQKEIGDLARIDASTMSHFKGKKRSLSAEKLARLAAVLRDKGYL